MTFADTVARITRDYNLATLGEDSVKQWVILPLLRRVDWNDETSEVTPEFPVRGDRVDYALRLGDENCIFLEAKAGNVDLAQHEEQLEGYCRGIDVTLGVLTNGRQWWLYVRPRKNAGIGRFTEFDITHDTDEVENTFRQFLSRDKMADAQTRQKTQTEARRQLRNRRDEEAERKRMIAAWNEFAGDEQAQVNFVANLAEQKGPRPDDSHVRKFLSSQFDLVNPIDTSCTCIIRPESFTFESQGKVEVKSWKQVVLKVCDLMQKRHPETFADRLSDIGTAWVEKSKHAPSDKFTQIGNTEIWINAVGSAGKIRDMANRVLKQFEYPGELSIKKRKCPKHAA